MCYERSSCKEIHCIIDNMRLLMTTKLTNGYKQFTVSSVCYRIDCMRDNQEVHTAQVESECCIWLETLPQAQ